MATNNLPAIRRDRLCAVAIAALALLATACDDDPSAPRANFVFAGCPTGNLLVNAPISLNFSSAVAASTVTPANVVVANAVTGFEIPGGLSVGNSGRSIVFTPSAPLPFGERVSVRVQNVLDAAGQSQTGVVVCNLVTEPPPIAEVVWDRLPDASGGLLTGATMYMPDSGFVAATQVPIYRRVGNQWQVRFNQPYFAQSSDVDFINALHGWGAHFDTRNSRGVITRSLNGGNSWDTVSTFGSLLVNRLRVDSARTGRTFGIGGGGAFSSANFYKLDPATDRWRQTTTFSAGAGINGFSSVADVDFAPRDTLNLAAVSRGVRINASTIIFIPGRIYRSTNAGESWAEIPGTAADTGRIITYLGVAQRANGDIFVTGGNGYFARIANGSNTLQRINLGLVSRDTLDFNALIYTDVQFAPDNDQVGWLIGSRLSPTRQNDPRRVGVIFTTRDGGATWIRQGVRGANDYGAEFPGLNRLEVFSATKAWAVGEGGVVLSLNP
ncbi:MAG TPA: Ig-like domain-containing protein [Gemmatimonadaceae bacterium]|nr:Ig-like domain-containing protein [Gemmatimonadaceae bacterium]